jgi:hypothetical protein
VVVFSCEVWCKSLLRGLVERYLVTWTRVWVVLWIKGFVSDFSHAFVRLSSPVRKSSAIGCWIYKEWVWEVVLVLSIFSLLNWLEQKGLVIIVHSTLHIHHRMVRLNFDVSLLFIKVELLLATKKLALIVFMWRLLIIFVIYCTDRSGVFIR